MEVPDQGTMGTMACRGKWADRRHPILTLDHLQALQQHQSSKD